MPIGATVVFSSVAGRFGNAGQTDYSAANGFLCSMSRALRRVRPETRTIAIDWTAWGGIGMAPRGSIPTIMAAAGISMLPPEAGIPTVRRELVAGGRSGELVVAGTLGIMGEEFVDVPIIGRVAAGEPMLAVENVEDTVRVDRFFIGNNREVFGLRIVGESMIEDGIFDGDYVFVKKTPTANKGDIVVAMVEDEATVKRYYPEGDQIRFQPANSNMAPIMVRKSDFRKVDLIGVVVGVYRKL